VRTLGVVELERSGDSFEHAIGHTVEVTPFKSRVVGHADAGEHRHLLAA